MHFLQQLSLLFFTEKSEYNKVCKQFTFATVIVSISWVTSPVTVTSLFVTRKVVQTVTTTVVDIIVFIGSVFTFCDNRFFFV